MKFWGDDRRTRYAIVAGLALTAGVLASVFSTERVHDAQQAERDDLELFLDASSAGWAAVTEQFFLVPEAEAQTIGALLGQTDSAQEQIELLAESIRETPALDAAFVGFPDGSFVFVGRSDETNDGFRTRIISFEGAERRVELTWTDSAVVPLRSEVDPSDTYDPRLRPWFTPIAEGSTTVWTTPYVFASSQEPGITHSAAVIDADGEVEAVVGIDIRLTQLSEFLNALRPGANGEALVIDRSGQVIASSPMNTTDRAGATLEQSADLLELVGDLQSNGTDESVSSRSGDGIRTTVARPASRNSRWYLAVRALDTDFLGDVSVQPTRNLLGILATGIAAATVVALLGFGALRYVDRLNKEAGQDELTGIANRRSMKRTIDAMLLRAEPFALAIIDLDDFKAINDTHGHPAGDHVLATIAERLDDFALNNAAQAGRLGGDEFVLVTRRSDIDWAGLVTLLAEPTNVDGTKLGVTVSIGIADSHAMQPLDAAALLSSADHALFEAKRCGGNRHVIETSMDRSAP